MIQKIKRQEGFGDTVAFFTEATGIKYAVEKAVELGIIEDCGCNKRQEQLNNPDLLINKIFYGNKGENS
jgi:hypothetical protein